MTWQDDLRAQVPRQDLPTFLTDLQALVAALREDRPWQLTPTLRRHAQLVLAYLSPGPARDRVERSLRTA